MDKAVYERKTAQAVQLESIVVSEANTDAQRRVPDSCCVDSKYTEYLNVLDIGNNQ